MFVRTMLSLPVLFSIFASILLPACKTTTPQSSASAQTHSGGSGAVAIPCDGKTAFTGVCSVSDITGRLGTPTETARSTRLKEVQEIRLQVPGRDSDSQAVITFHKVKGEKESWRITEALDLYDRRGCIAQVSGGVFDDGFTPRFTFRALFNVRNSSQSGFAEVTEHLGKPVHATVTLECEWSR